MTQRRTEQDKTAARHLPAEPAADLRFLRSVFAELTGEAATSGRAARVGIVETPPKSPET